jgi:hypothetical protein
MRPLKGELLLGAWERGVGESDLARALTLLAVACDDQTPPDLADLSIADRDLELLRLRRLMFGDSLQGCLPCGACATRVEFEISVSSILDRLEALRPPAEAAWSAGRFVFSMRAVTSHDLTASLGTPDPRRDLLARCTSVQAHDGDDAPSNWEDLVVDQFNHLNEGAETRLTIPCPACGEINQEDLDIARFLWAEVRHTAVATLREVHELASAYGWSEAAILSMNGARRSMYLEMART